MSRLASLLFFLAVVATAPAHAQGDPWQALAEGGRVALLRHADAPGTGDPPAFDLADCATQRNLGTGGREEARALGDRLRAEGVEIAGLLSSAWCRCLETARLLGFGEPTVEPALNSLFAGRGDPETQVPALRALVAGWQEPGTLMLVSHSSVISRLTGEYPREGEFFVLEPAPGTEAGFEMIGRAFVEP